MKYRLTITCDRSTKNIIMLKCAIVLQPKVVPEGRKFVLSWEHSGAQIDVLKDFLAQSGIFQGIDDLKVERV